MRFEVKAFRENEGIVALLIDADDKESASLIAKEQGYDVISSTLRRSWIVPRSRFPIALFTQELLCLLEAGIPLLEAIEALSSKETAGQSRRIYADLLEKLKEGKSFSSVLAKHPETFPTLYIALVQASEKTGDLNEALSRYLAYRSHADSIRKKFLSASVYPALLLVAGTAVIIFLLAYVIPRFSKIYEDVGGDLPLLSTLLLKWGTFFSHHPGGILGTSAIAFAVLAASVRRYGTAFWIRKITNLIPVISLRFKQYQLANLYRAIGMLLRGGIPLLTAIDMTGGLLDPALQVALHKARESIWEGKHVSDSMRSCGLTTEVAVRMLRAGEYSGNLGEMMERIAFFYDEETARWIDWFTRLLEPSIMIIIGFVIGTIVLLMYMPIFDLASSIQ